ncbi:MAG: 4'-phosphopantetheinyl transferase superfamily protein [Solirubrobacteraceae bacterium]
MPIKQVIKHDFCTKIIIWQLTETAEEFLSFLSLNEVELSRLNKLSKKKGLEFLAIRACLNELKLNGSILKYTQRGKPFLANEQFVSISHSREMVSVAISNKRIGVDIEINRPEKLENIISKFICEEEQLWLENKSNKTDFLSIIWGIKESLYKLNGGNLYNFLNHYKVNAFNLIENTSIECLIIENKKSREYYAFYKKIDAYFLVWVTEKK